MKFKIPFMIGSTDKLKKRSVYFKKYIKYKKDSNLKKYLEISDSGVTREEYLAICIKGFLISLVSIFVFFSTIFVVIGISNAIVISLFLSILFSFFLTFSRLAYPKIYSTRREKEIEKNLIPALEDILVQLNSGIPLFNILINISSSDYSELSVEFKKTVRRINAGFPQAEVLELIGEKNTSPFFRRALWQISNGMKAGGDITIIIKDSIHVLEEEQLIQIQNYGNKLNPMIMFYMLISVIVPALSITFLTVISSIVNLTKSTTTVLFMVLFVFVVLVQIMFLGIIKSIRPSLL